MNRTFGWIQDSGSFSNLKKIILAMQFDSDFNKYLREIKIPKYIPTRFNNKKLIDSINSKKRITIPYEILKGKGYSCQLTKEENMDFFGYSSSEAEKIVKLGGRGNAACTGIAQIAIEGQKKEPNGSNKAYIGDWSAECFIRWGITLGFIDYDSNNDTCTISNIGERFAKTEDNSEDEKNLIGDALLSYPPACRVLQLINKHQHLTKFEIGKQLGFIDEAGFSSVSQTLYVGGIATAKSQKERNDIKQNYEGSSDKYARMIAGWLEYIDWIKRVPKTVSEHYLGVEYKIQIAQSYMITQKGQNSIKRINGGSRYERTEKVVFWHMLATAAPNSNYLRNRRFYLLKSLKTRKSIKEIQSFLTENGFNINESTLLDDINNLKCIGLEIEQKEDRFILKDKIIKLEIPYDYQNINITNNTQNKDALREKLNVLNHRYLILLDLAFNNKASREFEITAMSLFTDELNFDGGHLGGSRKPDGVFYKHNNGVIVDTKAYSNGYNLPIPQADEMIRYIEENKTRGNINPNKWWENFNSDVTNFSYLFISSKFKGHFLENLAYIRERTNYDGAVINVNNLLLFAEKIKSKKISVDKGFEKLRINNEIKFVEAESCSYYDEFSTTNKFAAQKSPAYK